MRGTFVAIAVIGLCCAASSAQARSCASPRALSAQGHRLPCRTAKSRPEPPRPIDQEALRAGRDPGFVDLGNGTELRISGRARADYGVRR